MSRRIDDFIHDMQIQVKRVDQRFDKIPRYYYWIFGGIFPAFVVMSIPSLSGLFFTIHATGLTWLFVFSFVTAVTTLLFACISIFILLFGILFILVIKDNKEKIIGIKKAIVGILTSKDTDINDADSEIISTGLRKIVNEELEAILKKYGIIPTIPLKTGLSISNESYQNLRNEFDEYKEKTYAELERQKKLIIQLLSEQSKTETNPKDAQPIQKDNRFESI